MKTLVALCMFLISNFALADYYSYVGIGVTLIENKEGIMVLEMVPKGPAERAGVLVDDYISRVDGVDTTKKSLNQVVKMIAGKEGESVTLTLTQDFKSYRDVNIVREQIVQECYMAGAVNLNFSNTIASGFIGTKFITFHLGTNTATAQYKGDFIRLNYESDPSGRVSLYGPLRGSYISWSGYNWNIFTQQPCIP